MLSVRLAGLQHCSVLTLLTVHIASQQQQDGTSQRSWGSEFQDRPEVGKNEEIRGPWIFFYARSSFANGDVQGAATQFQRATEIRPDDYQSACFLAQTYKALGRRHDAQTTARRAVELAERELDRHPEDVRPAQLGAGALIDLGEKDRAVEWTARAIAIEPDDPLAQYNAACAYCQLGEIELALDLLERSLPKLGCEKVHWSKHDPDLKPLRNHLRFRQLLDQLI